VIGHRRSRTACRARCYTSADGYGKNSDIGDMFAPDIAVLLSELFRSICIQPQL